MVSGSFDRKVQLYNVDTGKITSIILGHSGSVKCVFILEKKGLVISAGYDTSIRFVACLDYSLPRADLNTKHNNATRDSFSFFFIWHLSSVHKRGSCHAAHAAKAL